MDPPRTTATYDPRQWFSVSKGYESSGSALPPANTNTITPAVAAPTAKTDAFTPTTVYPPANTNKFTPAPAPPTAKFTPAPAPPTANIPPNNEGNSTSNIPAIDPAKLDLFIRRLQEMVAKLPREYRKKFPYDMICELAHSFMDGTVFEITKGLNEIQTLTESNLSARRTKLLEGHRVSKKELLRQQKAELAMFERKPQQLKAMMKQHEEAVAAFTQQCTKEVMNLDQKLVLELDRQVSDQQSTLQRAGLPFFFITNEPEDIKVQMYLLSFITKLSAGS